MLFKSIPRGTLAAALCSADLLSRFEYSEFKTPELHGALQLTCSYLTNINCNHTEQEFENAVTVVQIYLFDKHLPV